MDVHSSARAVLPRIAIGVGDARQQSLLADYLTSFYWFTAYETTLQTIAGCRADAPLLVLVSANLPTQGGYNFVRLMRADAKLATVPIVMLVANDDEATRDAVAQCGADDFLAGTFSRSKLLTTISGITNRIVERQWMELQPLQKRALTDSLQLFNGISNVIAEGKPIPYQGVSNACKPLVELVKNDDYRGMLHGVRNHDNYTYVHSIRVATYLGLIGFNLGLPEDEQLLLTSGGLLHDIGKMSIPHAVLNKPGRLTEQERAVMQGHVPATLAYLRRCDDLPKGIVTIAAQHHEKIDGSGYPLGLAGGKLNRLARMASIIDVFTALTDRRSYKPSMEPEAALQLMVDEMALELDIKLLGLFRQMLLDATLAKRPQVARPA